MRKMKFYTYEEVKGILDMLKNGGTNKETADAFGRTTVAITAIKSNFEMFQKDPSKDYVSGAMKSFFKSYLADKRESVESQTSAEENRVSETLAQDSEDNKQEAVLDELVGAMENLKTAVVNFVESEVKRGVEEYLAELDELQRYKIETEKELQELREFKTYAKENNFASMLRKKFRPSTATA